jgi:hypothetical protein
MTVAPIPVRSLVSDFQLDKWMVLTVSLTEVHTVGAIFVVIPVVIVLVTAVIDPVLVVVAVMLFLASVILVSRPSGHRRWYGQGCG